METYERAYRQYTEQCELFGMQPIDMIKFIQTVTQEQVEQMISQYTN
ncbi:hypothetical protein [Halalkalibacter alkalisediminis]|uniref:Phage protein n=1 Tax=Halalkalibacter alkalisediminis TaxID=935616 RepID=A0ABV6N9L6_9BACI|nr:hypothetical protein [Halalkalibacter alkalisediminis]